MINFIHLFNDFSGSPRVLSNVIFVLKKYSSILFVGSDGDGCLDVVQIKQRKYFYRRTYNKFSTLIIYIISQIHLFFSLCKYSRGSIIYINTLLPFGAAIYGLFARKKVIYHIHEVSLRPKILNFILVKIASHLSNKIICVSEFVRTELNIPDDKSIVIHNSVDPKIYFRSIKHQYRQTDDDGYFNVLMLSSLKIYKGIDEFVLLANWFNSYPEIRFHLVLNESNEIISKYFKKLNSKNIFIHGRTSCPEDHYVYANLVLNLSHPDKWIETFGLTLAEAMCFGIPVIAPPIGGPTEFINDGVDGYLVDYRNFERLVDLISLLATDKEKCTNLSIAAKNKSVIFSPHVFENKLNALFK